MEQKIIEQLESIINKEYSNTMGMVVIKNNAIVYESYFHNCSAESCVHVYSVTKSVLSILFGIAIDHGYIKSVDQSIADFFPHDKGDVDLHKITIRNLLTMTVSYKYRIPPYKKYFMSEDWVRFSLDQIKRKQTGKFYYAPLIGPDILSGILVKATGRSVLDFAREYLFGPLDITVEQNITFQNKEEPMAYNTSIHTGGWVADPQGVNAAAWGLSLSAMDMAKLGQLYLNHGMWKGKQIVSEKWIKESTSKQSQWEKRNISYGYLWWLGDEKDHGYAAMGDGGNMIYTDPDNGIVVAIASLFVPKAKDRISFIKKNVLPIFTEM